MEDLGARPRRARWPKWAAFAAAAAAIALVLLRTCGRSRPSKEPNRGASLSQLEGPTGSLHVLNSRIEVVMLETEATVAGDAEVLSAASSVHAALDKGDCTTAHNAMPRLRAAVRASDAGEHASAMWQHLGGLSRWLETECFTAAGDGGGSTSSGR
jgi:hypothetical protein